VFDLNSVSSGGQGMSFFWREDQLLVKHGPTGCEDRGWTTFLMDMRESIKVYFILHSLKNYIYYYI